MIKKNKNKYDEKLLEKYLSVTPFFEGVNIDYLDSETKLQLSNTLAYQNFLLRLVWQDLWNEIKKIFKRGNKNARKGR
jgi:hypothetical protein